MAKNNDKLPEKDTLDSLVGAGLEVPKDDQINFDSYMDGVDPSMRDMLAKMQKASREKTKEAEAKLGINQEDKKPEEPEYTEVKMDQSYWAKEQIEKAKSQVRKVQQEDAEEIDEAIEFEKQRIKELEEHPENDPNYMPRNKKTGKQKKEGTAAEEDKSDVGEILGEDYVPEKTETAEEDDSNDDMLLGEEFMPDLMDDESSEDKKDEEEKKEDVDEDEIEYNEDDSDLERVYKQEERFEKIINDTKEVIQEPDPDPIVKVIQKKTELVVETDKSARVREFNDDAFLNKLTAMRRSNFRIVEVPLLNSGFMVEMNGLGPGDLVSLYDLAESMERSSTSTLEYLNAQMKIIAKAIVKITPSVNRNNLFGMVHYADLNMLMYGVVAATLDEAKYPWDCEHCGESFRVTVPVTDIILNKDDVKDRIEQIRNAKDIKETSLLEHSYIMRFPSGYEVTLGHASLAAQRALMTSLERYTQNKTLSEVDQMALASAAGAELPWIKAIVAPGGLMAKNPWQTVKILNLMDEDERRQIIENVRKLQKELYPHKLGVKNVKCPHCGKVNEAVRMAGLANLIFFQRRADHALIHRTEK